MSSTVKQKGKSKSTVANKSQKNQRERDNKLAEKKALIEKLCGSLSWVNYSVDEYLREKHEETEIENRS